MVMRQSDTAQISLQFEDGSIASIQYYANGHRSFPKERVEVFASGRILQLENFRVLRGFGILDFGSSGPGGRTKACRMRRGVSQICRIGEAFADSCG